MTIEARSPDPSCPMEDIRQTWECIRGEGVRQTGRDELKTNMYESMGIGGAPALDVPQTDKEPPL